MYVYVYMLLMVVVDLLRSELFLFVTSAPIGQTDLPTVQLPDMGVHREATLPMIITCSWCVEFPKYLRR